MSSKSNTEVIIDGKIYTLSGYESEEYLQKVATYINNKIIEFKESDSFRRQIPDVQRTLLNINVADEYFKIKKQADTLELELESKDKQLYEVKHELIASQIKAEASEKELEKYKKQISDLQKEIIRLETKLVESKEREASPKEHRTYRKKEDKHLEQQPSKQQPLEQQSLEQQTLEQQLSKQITMDL